jgi:hypothetical protein
MGNVPSPSSPSPLNHPLLQTTLTPIDPLHPRPNPNNRHPQNPPLLRSPPKAQGNSSLRGRHPSDPAPVAADRVPGGAVRDIRAVWGLLCYDCGVCGECACCGTVVAEGFGEVGWGEEEC